MLAVQHETGYNVEHGQSRGQGCDVVKQEFDNRGKSGPEDVRDPGFGVLQGVIGNLYMKKCDSFATLSQHHSKNSLHINEVKTFIHMLHSVTSFMDDLESIKVKYCIPGCNSRLQLHFRRTRSLSLLDV